MSRPARCGSQHNVGTQFLPTAARVAQGTFQTFTAEAQQALPASAPNAAAIAETASRPVGAFFQFRRPRSGSEM